MTCNRYDILLALSSRGSEEYSAIKTVKRADIFCKDTLFIGK